MIPESFTPSFGTSFRTADEYQPHDGKSNKSCTPETCSAATKFIDTTNPNYECKACNPEAGSYVPFEVMSTGASGTRDYERAMMESKMARDNPTLLAQSTDAQLDVSWHEAIVPNKPLPVSLAGMDVFGTDGPTTTTRNMTTDFRGEAVDVFPIGQPPEGAGISSRMGNIPVSYNDPDIPKGLPKELVRNNTENNEYEQSSSSGITSFMAGFFLLPKLLLAK
jgi:hypothetical protein